MIVLREKNINWLKECLESYEYFSLEGKKYIAFICIKNLLYSIDKEKGNELIKQLLDVFYEDNWYMVLDRVYDMSNYYDMGIPFITELRDIIVHVKQDKCPLVKFAFGKSILPIEKNESDIIELSIMYLFRFECVKYSIPNNYRLVSSSGSNCEVYENAKQDMICKIAKNYVSYKYLLEQEFENVTELGKTGLSEYIPKYYSYNKDKGWLFHEDIRGIVAGSLVQKGVLPDIAQKQLEKFYSLYNNRLNKNIILDIHPDNFIWDETNKKLVLIDLGSIPKIGSEYYEYNNFQDYFCIR